MKSVRRDSFSKLGLSTTLAPRWAPESRIAWWRGFGIFCLILASTAILSPAQDQQPSNDSVRFTDLVNFDGTDGADPYYVSPVQGTDGNLYGTTSSAGANNAGTVFKMTPTGTLTTLYNFCAQANCSDGNFPNGLVLGTDGDFYGTTQLDGANSNACDSLCGTFFKVTPRGTLTTLYSFCAQINCTDGVGPEVPLVQGANGNFYGTTQGGGAYGDGTVFEITPGGILTTLHSFDRTDGSFPSGVIQATNGSFYGTSYFGGTRGDGTVFKISRAGAFTILYSFCTQTNCTDGGGPNALVQGADGNFYGTTQEAGAYGYGTVFEIAPSETLTTLYSFCSQSGCPDGQTPLVPLVQATDGNLYGGTFMGGANGDGTIFKITPGGTLKTLHSFDVTDGRWPGGLAQATNGTFYGTTLYGGNDNCGGGFGCATVFSLAVGLGPFVETLPTSGKVGAHVEILGTDLTGATSVSFNGTAAAFKVISKTLISATVPEGAPTGKVEVTIGNETLSSSVLFRVRP